MQANTSFQRTLTRGGGLLAPSGRRDSPQPASRRWLTPSPPILFSRRLQFVARREFGPLNSGRWRGASRRPNGRELNERPVSGAAPANRAFKLTDAGYSRTRRAPEILRRSLTPVR
jgi:hypothetical protein